MMRSNGRRMRPRRMRRRRPPTNRPIFTRFPMRRPIFTRFPTITPIATAPPTTNPPSRPPIMATTAPTVTPVVNTNVPTPAATTPTPDVNAPTVTPGESPAPTFATVRTATTGDCEFTVNIDLQIDFFEDELAACNTFTAEFEIWETIAGAISAATQPTVFLNYQAGTEYFDEEQELGLFVRRLQQITCSPRLDTEVCDANIYQQCRWGCLTAFGQGDDACNNLSVDTFKQLEDEVTQALVNYTTFRDELCLGEPGNLNVLIRAVEENEGDGAAARNAGPAVRAGATANSASRNANILAGTAAANFQEKVTEGTSKALKVRSELAFGFFAGRGRQPTAGEIQGFITETVSFFTQTFKNDDLFAVAFQTFSIVNETGIYYADSPDQFRLQFTSIVEIVLDSALTDGQAMNVMASSKFQDYIGRFAKKAEPIGWNEIMKTHTAFFRGQ